MFRDEVCYPKGAVRTDEVIHAACDTNNGEGRVGRRRCWPEPRQPGPDAGVTLTNPTARNTEAAGHPDRTPIRASRPEQKLHVPQTTSAQQLQKTPIKTSPVCYTLHTCSLLATTSGFLPHVPLLPWPGSQACRDRSQGAWPRLTQTRLLPPQSSFREHLYL